MLISVPASLLTASGTSDVSHITDIYTQLTDGTRELCAGNLACENLICTTFKGSLSAGERLNISFLNKNTEISGNYSQNIDIILKQNGYQPSDYREKMMCFAGEHYSYDYTSFAVVVQSVKNEYKV